MYYTSNFYVYCHGPFELFLLDTHFSLLEWNHSKNHVEWTSYADISTMDGFLQWKVILGNTIDTKTNLKVMKNKKKYY